jgi:tetratricopeptide (TPR) repeat protein
MAVESHVPNQSPPSGHTVPASGTWLAELCLWAIVLLFSAAGLVRAVPFHILTPDSGDYLIAARSLVTGNGYRDLSSPGDPPFTWRPPGLAVILMPAAAIGADCSTYSKVLIVLYGAILLWCLHRFASRYIGPNWALLPVLLVAASPQVLVYSTEVLSEVPFTACLLALLCLAHDWESGRTSAGRLVAIGLLLVALPMLRTVGAPLVGVWMLWSMTSRHRWKLLIPSLAAGGILFAWSLYLRSLGGARYDSLVTEVLRAEGPFKFLLAGVVNLLTYLTELNRALFPGLLTDSFVELVTDRPLPPLFGARTGDVVSFGGTIVLAGAVSGLIWQRDKARGLSALTIGAYAATVCLYPLRSERLLWPLIPVLWTLFVSGLLAGAARLLRGATLPRRQSLILAMVLAVLAVSQLRDWPGMLRPAWQYWTARDRFYSDTRVPGYYSDWRAAAAFLHEQAHPTDTVMTMVKEFHTVSGLQQVRLEIGRSPAEMAEGIAANHTRWLVIGYGYSRRAMDRLLWHPRYSFALRYPRHSEYEIYEVLPNRDGTIPVSIVQTESQPDMPPDSSLWDRANREFHNRRFSVCAEHLRELHQTASTLASHLLLARAEAQSGAFDEARLCYRRMRLLESNESFAREIVDGVREIEILEEMHKLAADEKFRRTSLGVELATIHCDWGRYDEAWELIENLKNSFQNSGEVLAFEGRLLDWMGRSDDAEKSLAAAIASGYEQAEKLLINRLWSRALESSGASRICAGSTCMDIDPQDVQCHLDLADRWAAEGLQGRSLKVLEQAGKRFPANRGVQASLESMRAYFGLSDGAGDAMLQKGSNATETVAEH